jgi:hypothetical protein
MTKVQAKPAIASVNDLFSTSPDGLREIVRAVMQEMLVAEMTDALRARRRASARRPGSAAAPAITPERLSPGWASSSCARRRIGMGGSRPSSSNATRAPNKRWWRR